MQLSTPRLQISHAIGIRNGRGRSGWVRRRISTPAQTAANAISVPIEVSSPRTSSGNTAASSAMPMPVITVLMCGVRYVGWILVNSGGSSPSRPMIMKMRGCAITITSTTEDSPISAPISTTTRNQPSCGCAATAVTTGSSVPSSWYGTSPVITAAMAMYNTVQITSESSMPIGMSRCGLCDSCAATDTASKPI